MKSLVSKHTSWYNFMRQYRFVIDRVILTKKVGDGKCLVQFLGQNEKIMGTETFNSCSIAYRVFANRLGVDFVECVGFIPTRVPSTYRKEVSQKWGWN